MTRRRAAALSVGAFLAMEPVAYAAHRWVMHGPGWGWHRSHHRRRRGTFERNDRYPVTFATTTVAAMAVGAAVARLRWLLPVGAGVSAYGAAYAYVHDVHIHGRVPAIDVDSAVLDRLARAHEQHHRGGGEPYGMLVPVLARRSAADGPAGSPASA